MKVEQEPNKTINLFDMYQLFFPPGLKYHQDGLPGHRVLFISDEKETFTISFEEDMEMMDLRSDTGGDSPVRHQCCKDGKYLHLKRNSGGRVVCVFFHFELQANNGGILYLPGQMVVFSDYEWSDGVEPVLMELLEGISFANQKMVSEPE